MLKKLLKTGAIIIGIILTSIIIALNVLMKNSNTKKYISELNTSGIAVNNAQVLYGDYKINTILVGDSTKPKVLLIHGSPGQWYDWVNLYKSEHLLNQYCLISYDRPGHGQTTISALPHLKEQAKVAAKVIEYYQVNAETFVVAGHSYGAAVVEQLLLDYPSLVNKGIYAGGTVSPEMQESKWFNHLADFGLINIILPKPFQTSNIEMMALTESLQKNTPRLSEITLPIVFIQGRKDVLVPFETVNYYKLNKPSGVVYIIDEKMNHFIPWSHPELVIDAILD